MRLQTATEIERQAEERNRVARVYESLLDEVAASDRAVDYYQRITSEPDKDLLALQTILSVIADVSETHVTKGSQFMPGGFMLRDVIRMEVGRAMAKSKAARTALEAKVQPAVERAADARKNLDAFERKHASRSTSSSDRVVATGEITLSKITAEGVVSTREARP